MYYASCSNNEYIARMISKLCDVSRLIHKLVENGYPVNNVDSLSALLQNLDIHGSPDDVLALLKINATHEFPTGKKFSIKLALTICDELCAPTIIKYILQHDVLLNTVMDKYIINSGIMTLQKYIDAFNNGYKIIARGNSYSTAAIRSRSLNNAFDNGLFLRSIIVCRIADIDNVSQYLLIIHVHSLLNSYPIPQKCTNIESVRNMHNIDKLSAKNIKTIDSVFISDDELKLCTNLRELYMCNNKNITTCAPFSNTIRILDAHWSSISNDGLQMCRQINKLDISNTVNITTCKPFAKTLVVLYANNSNMTDAGLAYCTRIKVLRADHDNKITTCEPFAKTLKSLSAVGSCGISNYGLIHCYKLKILDIRYNSKINTIKHFSSLKRIVYRYGAIPFDLTEELNMRKNIVCAVESFCDDDYQ